MSAWAVYGCGAPLPRLRRINGREKGSQEAACLYQEA